MTHGIDCFCTSHVSVRYSTSSGTSPRLYVAACDFSFSSIHSGTSPPPGEYSSPKPALIACCTIASSPDCCASTTTATRSPKVTNGDARPDTQKEIVLLSVK